MTEIEELKKRLKEKEYENTELRKALNRKPRIGAFPSDIMCKYPLLSSMYGGFASSEPWISISKAIRLTLFSDVKKRVVHGEDRERNIRGQDMNEIQYSLYSETLDEVLSALNKGREKVLEINAEEESA